MMIAPSDPIPDVGHAAMRERGEAGRGRSYGDIEKHAKTMSFIPAVPNYSVDSPNFKSAGPAREKPPKESSPREGRGRHRSPREEGVPPENARRSKTEAKAKTLPPIDLAPMSPRDLAKRK